MSVTICTIETGGRRFGLEMESLLEVVRPHGLRRVPLCPAYVRGVMPYRGEVLTVVDLRSLLRLPALAGDGGCVLVLEGEDERFGLLVDAVGAVIEDGPTEALPAGVGDRMSWLLQGVRPFPDFVGLRLAASRLSPGRLREAVEIFKEEKACGC